MYFIEIFTIIFLGLVLGSFSTALIYRVPRKLPWGNERSSCPVCKSTLGVFDLFPILSWVISGGKCRHCSNKIPCIYPMIELTSVVLCLLVYLVFGFNAETFFIILAVPILISLFFIDIEHMILPNQLTFILFAVGGGRLIFNLVYNTSLDNYYLYEHVAGTFIYAFLAWLLGVVFTKILKKDALGFGDVKFFGLAGLWLGVSILPYFLILSGGLAILFSICWKITFKTEVFPFGPALVLSLYVLLLSQSFF